MNEQKASLDKYRLALEQKMADFDAQKDALNSSLSQSKEQASQFSQIENDYKKRMDILKQTVTVQRQRYESRIQQLTDDLNKAVAGRNQIALNLEKCGAARDGVVSRVNQLTEENAKLKDMYLQIKTKMELTRAQFESHMEKVRANDAKMQSDIRTCAQRLQDATLVHAHVEQMKEEAQKLRANLEENISKAKGNQAALQRLLQDRELEKQQVNRLQSALKDCAIQKSQAEVGLENTNESLREVKRMNGQLGSDVKQLAGEYRRVLDSNEASMAKQQLATQLTEDSLKRQLAELQSRNKEALSKNERLNASKTKLLDTIASSEFDRQRQIEMLIDAQREMSKNAKNTGKSNLVDL